MCGHTSTFPQGFPGGEPFFTAFDSTHTATALILTSVEIAENPACVRYTLPPRYPCPLYAPKTHVTVLWPRMRGAHSHGYCLCLTWLPRTSNNAATPYAAS